MRCIISIKLFITINIEQKNNSIVCVQFISIIIFFIIENIIVYKILNYISCCATCLFLSGMKGTVPGLE